MYWIYARHTFSWRNQYVQAQLLTEENFDEVKEMKSGFGFDSIIQDKPYGVDLDLIYQVNPKHPHPDNYAESHSFRLFSKRLIDLMAEFEVNFEAFPVTMVDQKENELHELQYYVFHSLEGVLDAMDEKASEWQGDWRVGIPRLVLDYKKFEHRPIFVCEHILRPLMRDDLRQAIRERAITGFDFLALEKYRDGKYGPVTRYDD